MGAGGRLNCKLAAKTAADVDIVGGKHAVSIIAACCHSVGTRYIPVDVDMAAVPGAPARRQSKSIVFPGVDRECAAKVTAYLDILAGKKTKGVVFTSRNVHRCRNILVYLDISIQCMEAIGIVTVSLNSKCAAKVAADHDILTGTKAKGVVFTGRNVHHRCHILTDADILKISTEAIGIVTVSLNSKCAAKVPADIDIVIGRHTVGIVATCRDVHRCSYVLAYADIFVPSTETISAISTGLDSKCAAKVPADIDIIIGIHTVGTITAGCNVEGGGHILPDFNMAAAAEPARRQSKSIVFTGIDIERAAEVAVYLDILARQNAESVIAHRLDGYISRHIVTDHDRAVFSPNAESAILERLDRNLAAEIVLKTNTTFSNHTDCSFPG